MKMEEFWKIKKNTQKLDPTGCKGKISLISYLNKPLLYKAGYNILQIFIA